MTNSVLSQRGFWYVEAKSLALAALLCGLSAGVAWLLSYRAVQQLMAVSLVAWALFGLQTAGVFARSGLWRYAMLDVAIRGLLGGALAILVFF